MTRIVLFVALFCLAALGLPFSLAAKTVVETETVTVEFRGTGEAGVSVASEAHSRETGPYIGLARIAGRAEYDGLGRVFVQYEAAGGNGRLLDLLTVLYLTDWLQLRLGYFKTPVSADYNVSTARKPFPRRALLTELTPRRGAGGELQATLPLGEAELNLFAGAFDPRYPAAAGTQALHLTAKAELSLPNGLGLHLGYSENFDRATWHTEESPFFATQPRLIDLAATYDTTRWFAHAEVVIAPHRAPFATPAGLYLAAAHRFGDRSEAPTLEPIIGYDFVAPDVDAPFHRVRAGLNYYLLNTNIVPNVHYEATIDDEGTIAHALLALLRIAI